MISTFDLSGLPAVAELRRLMQSLAMLDAILCPQWEHRYFSFDNHWAPDQHLATMQNGQGDHYFALFKPEGCWLKGFNHEVLSSPFSKDPRAAAILDNVPLGFSDCLKERAFVIEETTFCIWRGMNDAAWNRGSDILPQGQDADGSAALLRYLDGDPETYRDWAEEYYECPVLLSAVQTIYAHVPFNLRTVIALNPDRDRSSLERDIWEIGFPT